MISATYRSSASGPAARGSGGLDSTPTSSGRRAATRRRLEDIDDEGVRGDPKSVRRNDHELADRALWCTSAAEAEVPSAERVSRQADEEPSGTGPPGSPRPRPPVAPSGSACRPLGGGDSDRLARPRSRGEPALFSAPDQLLLSASRIRRADRCRARCPRCSQGDGSSRSHGCERGVQVAQAQARSPKPDRGSTGSPRPRCRRRPTGRVAPRTSNVRNRCLMVILHPDQTGSRCPTAIVTNRGLPLSVISITGSRVALVAHPPVRAVCSSGSQPSRARTASSTS